ncbi:MULTISPECIES: hypothetical protein [Roseateles]|uniref:DUF3299 domain-containing protein n=1 Tax=Pelomonas caseinilytica TaxID=2906763 RepID=A0ABS8XKS6_9BURK|nr:MULTISPECIES: hypothetical protein [unclassified Roseateles]MCE4537840.1 hypothetical protein [Pelomonas sp. P7]HEV6965916.1 hypothetical protein [Roseateles sp.]
MRAIPLLVLALAGPCLPPTAQALPPVELAFGDFFVRPIGPRGLEPTARLQAANGREVRLVGFMVQREQALAGQFMLTPRPVAMAEHADGEADDLPASTVTVLLPEGQRDRVVAHQAGPLAVVGRLEYGPAEDATGRVSWLRLRLAADALDSQPLLRPIHPQTD